MTASPDPVFPYWLGLLTLAGCALFFLHVDNDGYWPGWARAVWNTGHVPVFAGLAWAIWPRLLPGRRLLARWSLGLLLALLAGVAVELGQVAVGGREVSFDDVLLDLAGAWLGLWWASHRRLWRQYRRGAVAAAISVALVAMLVAAPVLRLGASALAGHGYFPVLLNGAMPGLLERMDPSGDAMLSQQSDGLTVRFGDGHFPGFKLFDMPRDWRDFRQLVLTVDNPGAQSLPLTCRLRDVVHNLQFSDRFNQRYLLPPGPSVVTIELAIVEQAPAGRLMDLHDMLEIGCFSTAEQAGRSLLVREIRLR